jgi:hypothetical protein
MDMRPSVPPDTFVLFLVLVLLLDGLHWLLLHKTSHPPANAWLALLGATWFGLHPATVN